MSSYLQHLPAILQQDEFLGRFLLAFEAILSGLDLTQITAPTPDEAAAGQHLSGLMRPVGLVTANKLIGLEQILDVIHLFFDPDGAPEDFLPWLAQWVATSLRDDWNAAQRRAFIGKIVPLYRKRGTIEGIEQVLLLSGDPAQVVERSDRTWPHYFEVILPVYKQAQDSDPNETLQAMIARKQRRVRAIVDREKPAHTYYSIRLTSPAMQINNNPQVPKEYGPDGAKKPWGPGILVGKTTILGTVSS